MKNQKNQLFRVSPNIEVTERILENFGIKGLNDNHAFTRENLSDLDTVNASSFFKIDDPSSSIFDLRDNK